VSDVYLRNPLGAGERLSTLGLPGNLLVLSVCRDDEMIIPHGNTRLEIGDRLTILGDHEHLQLATMWLESTDGR
jgi:Trk K+ transport system NAD-binding subunit